MSTTLAACLLALAACGGSGGSGQPAIDSATAQAISSASPPTAQAVPAPADDSVGADAAPMVFNASASARPGDVVSLQGENFGDAPTVWLEAVGTTSRTTLPVVNRVGSGWLAVQIPFEATGALVLRIDNGRATSAPLPLNAATPQHLDATEIVPGGPFRLFGRNLALPGSTPTVTVAGLPALINRAMSGEHMLVLTAPQGLRASDAVAISVDNGNGTGAATLNRRVSVNAQASGDPLGMGVGWSAAFLPLLDKRIDAATDTRLPRTMRCDGTSDDAPALRAALQLAQRLGGATVALPAGTCLLGSGVQLHDRTVLQGAGQDRTELRHATDSALHASNADLIALRDFSLVAAMAPGSATSGINIKHSRRVALQRVRVHVGATAMVWLYGITNLAVVDSTFTAAGNTGGPGALHLALNTGLHLARNRITFFDGVGTNLDRTGDAYVAGNTWLRDASQPGPTGTVHVVTLNFAHHIAIVGNSFDAFGRTLDASNNDGEILLTEGGGAWRTEGMGRATGGGRDTLADMSASVHPNVLADATLPENFGIAIVAGKGAGQTRRVVAFADGRFTVEPPWQSVPDTTSRYATALWGLERALIKDNQLRNQPRGIWLYSTAVRDVDIVGNRLEDSGGILLRAHQKVAERAFTPVFNVRIQGNQIRNDAARHPSHVSLHLANLDGQAWGSSHVGIELRRNAIAATGIDKDWSPHFGPAAREGYLVQMNVEVDSAVPDPAPRLLGTVLQDNSCSRCSSAFWLGTGAAGTVLAGNLLPETGRLWTNTVTVRGAAAATATTVR